MKVKNLLLFGFFILSSTVIFAQKNIWTKTDESRIALTPAMERKIQPQKYEVWQADFQSLKTMLDRKSVV